MNPKYLNVLSVGMYRRTSIKCVDVITMYCLYYVPFNDLMSKGNNHHSCIPTVYAVLKGGVNLWKLWPPVVNQAALLDNRTYSMPYSRRSTRT